MIKGLTPPGLEHVLGRYTPGVVVDMRNTELVFVTGQVAVDDQGQTVGVGDIVAQTEQVYRNLGRVLESAGGTFANLVQVTAYLTARADFDAFNAVRNYVFRAFQPPSSTVVVVAGLVVPEHLVEISAVAAIAEDRL